MQALLFSHVYDREKSCRVEEETNVLGLQDFFMWPQRSPQSWNCQNPVAPCLVILRAYILPFLIPSLCGLPYNRNPPAQETSIQLRTKGWTLLCDTPSSVLSSIYSHRYRNPEKQSSMPVFTALQGGLWIPHSYNHYARCLPTVFDPVGKDAQSQKQDNGTIPWKLKKMWNHMIVERGRSLCV